MFNIKFSRSKQVGIGIVEIMISMVLGLMLTAGITNVYMTTKSSYRLAENLSRLQESARFGMNILTQDVRMTGFLPCRITGDVTNTLNDTDSFLDFFNRSIVGYEGGVSTFASEFPATGTNAGDRVAGSDAFAILRGSSNVFSVVSHQPSAELFTLDRNHNLVDDDIILICDGSNASITQATATNQTARTVEHDSGNTGPGNCNADLGGGADCASGTFAAFTYEAGSQLAQFQATGYYIGVSTTGDSRSLYKIGLGTGGASITNPIEELLEGIEHMQVLYGEDTDGDTEAERYVTANNVTTWNDVVSVRIGLLVHSPDQIDRANDTSTYVVAGTPIANTATTPTHGGDRRLRYSFTTTVKIRNRGLN